MRRRGVAPGVEILDGARPGPRMVVSGSAHDDDLLGVAVARQLAAGIEPGRLTGSLLLAPHGLDGHAAGPPAAFGIEIGSGPAGWITTPHVVADLGSPRAARLARAFGESVVVDGKGPLRFEAGERGRVDPAIVARAVDGIHALLVAARMLPGEPIRPAVRLVVDEITRLRSTTGGTLAPLGAAGTAVAAKSPLLAVCDLAGEPRTILTASRRSVILALPADGVALPGAAVARIGHVARLTRSRIVSPTRITVGWCEWITLPDLGVTRLQAKVDTGAKTSALHVLSMRKAGEERGRPVLELRLVAGRPAVRVIVEGEVVVRDSGGHSEKRPVIETTLVLGPIRRRVRVTLTDRGDMQFAMLIGRSALGSQVLVDPGARRRQSSR